MASLRQLENGRWQSIVRRRGHRPQSKTFSSRSDADRWGRQVENEIDRAVFVDRGPSERTQLGELFPRYRAEVLPGKKASASLGRALTGLERHFRAFTLATLQPRDIAAFRDARIASGRAGATVVRGLGLLSRLIDVAASEWGYYVPSNPVKTVRRPSVARGRERRLGPGEEKTLLEACEASRSPMLAGIVKIAIETGMRLGELLSLKWCDVDLTKRIAVLHDTKNGERRTVPLSTVAIDVFREIPRHITNNQVFWTWSRADSFENAWKRAIHRASIHDLRFHDLRHEAVSRLFERGFNMVEVSAISGHKTLQMLRRYTHLKAEDLALRLVS